MQPIIKLGHSPVQSGSEVPVKPRYDDTPPAASTDASAGSSRPSVPDDPVGRASEVIDQLITDLRGPETRLNIDQDEATGLFVYQLVDPKTGVIERQFPPDEVLRRVAAMREIEGMIFDDEV